MRGKLATLLSAIFWEDWPSKLVCLLLAGLSWAYIDGQLTDNLTLELPMNEVQRKFPKEFLPSDLLLAGDPFDAKLLKVTVRGPRRRLQFMKRDNLELVWETLLTGVDKSKLEGGRDENGNYRLNLLRVPLDSIKVTSPDAADLVYITRVDPQQLVMRLDRIYEKELQVLTRPQGRPLLGFAISSKKTPRISPEKILVRSLHELSEVNTLFTEPINVAGRREDFTTQAAIARTVKVGEKTIEVMTQVERVEVTIWIEKQDTSKTIPAVPLQCLAPPGRAMTVDAPNLTVRVSGAPNLIENLENRDLRLFVEWPVEWGTQQPGVPFPRRRVQVKAQAPEGIEVLAEDGNPLPQVEIQGLLLPPNAFEPPSQPK